MSNFLNAVRNVLSFRDFTSNIDCPFIFKSEVCDKPIIKPFFQLIQDSMQLAVMVI